jgi:hypothetical protein
LAKAAKLSRWTIGVTPVESEQLDVANRSPTHERTVIGVRVRIDNFVIVYFLLPSANVVSKNFQRDRVNGDQQRRRRQQNGCRNIGATVCLRADLVTPINSGCLGCCR